MLNVGLDAICRMVFTSLMTIHVKSTNGRIFNLATTHVPPKPNGDPLILVPHPVVSRQVMLMPREVGVRGS